MPELPKLKKGKVKAVAAKPEPAKPLVNPRQEANKPLFKDTNTEPVEAPAPKEAPGDPQEGHPLPPPLPMHIPERALPHPGDVVICVGRRTGMKLGDLLKEPDGTIALRFFASTMEASVRNREKRELNSEERSLQKAAAQLLELQDKEAA